MGSASEPETGADPRPGHPADDLAEVWKLLDVLPSATARVDLAATTVDLVAANVAAAAGGRERPPTGPANWGIRAAIVIGALLAGLAAGRSQAPDPDRRVLERLPLIEHLGLLRELGSVAFLEALADRLGEGQGPPRWMRFVRSPEDQREDARQFDAAVEALADAGVGRPADERILAERRARVTSLPTADREELERSAETYENLANVDRRDLAAVAEALVDPAARRLRDAARSWHLALSAMNPVFRRSVVEMPTSERLEVMDRWPDRADPRPPGRPRDEFRDRRPPEGERRPPEPRGEFDGPGPRQPRGGFNGSPRPDGFPGRFNGPPPFRPVGPPGEPRAAPAETRAPPR